MSDASKLELGEGPTFRLGITYSVWWNLLIITIGSLIASIGIKSLAVPHEFIPSGIFGLATLLSYSSEALSPGWIYFILNIPLFLFAWFKVSRRFLLYSLYATVAMTFFYESITVNVSVHSELYAAIASGVITGFGSGVVLRSFGSNGGLDVVAVFLYQRFNIGIGRMYFAFNSLLFCCSMLKLSPDLIIASLIMVFITSVVVDQTLSLFSQRKVVFIISDMSDKISSDILTSLRQSSTFLKGFGAYSRKERDVLMTVVNNVQLKKLEEITFTHDENALFIVENTFSVIGSSFSKRKIY